MAYLKKQSIFYLNDKKRPEISSASLCAQIFRNKGILQIKAKIVANNYI